MGCHAIKISHSIKTNCSIIFVTMTFNDQSVLFSPKHQDHNDKLKNSLSLLLKSPFSLLYNETFGKFPFGVLIIE